MDAAAARLTRLVLAAVATAAAVRAAAGRGRARRLVSFAARRARRASPPPSADDSRLYGSGRRRLETHLGRRADGSRVVVALSADGRRRRTVYRVGEHRPWHDFERQAGLLAVPWGPCRDLSAGL